MNDFSSQTLPWSGARRIEIAPSVAPVDRYVNPYKLTRQRLTP
jgi:hypothetical protein